MALSVHRMYSDLLISNPKYILRFSYCGRCKDISFTFEQPVVIKKKLLIDVRCYFLRPGQFFMFGLGTEVNIYVLPPS